MPWQEIVLRIRRTILCIAYNYSSTSLGRIKPLVGVNHPAQPVTPGQARDPRTASQSRTISSHTARRAHISNSAVHFRMNSIVVHRLCAGDEHTAKANGQVLTSSLFGSKARRGFSPPILRHSLSNAGSVHVLQQRASWAYVHFGSGSGTSPQKSNMSWRTSSMQSAECMATILKERRRTDVETKKARKRTNGVGLCPSLV